MVSALNDEERSFLSQYWTEVQLGMSMSDSRALSVQQRSFRFQSICDWLALRNEGVCPPKVHEVIEYLLA